MKQTRTLQKIIAVALAFISFLPGAGLAQEGEAVSAWQVEKCQIYRQNWEQALDLFGTDNMNYNFIARNENFMASGCTEPGEVCAQSNQEVDIANVLTLAMMNAGAASTFLPFRCHSSIPSARAQMVTGAARDSELCWSQLQLLKRGGKLTADEVAVFEAQCGCLERQEQSDTEADCAG